MQSTRAEAGTKLDHDTTTGGGKGTEEGGETTVLLLTKCKTLFEGMHTRTRTHARTVRGGVGERVYLTE